MRGRDTLGCCCSALTVINVHPRAIICDYTARKTGKPGTHENALEGSHEILVKLVREFVW